MHRVALALTLLAPLLAGCLSLTGGAGGDCVAADPVLLAGPAQQGLIPRAAGDPVHVLYWIDNTEDDPRDVEVAFEGNLDRGEHGPVNGSDGPVAPGRHHFGHLVHPLRPADEATGLDVGAALAASGAACDPAPATGLRFAPETTDERARGGVGVQVYTAGFWTNGTLFYTNMDRVQFDPVYPKPVAGEMGDWGGGAPLPVYVYNESREEEPRRYREAGYFTTIPGFNDALKGLQVGTSTVAVLAPEEAYTRSGYEDHPLYGDVLVFYIELISIEREPCPVPDPVCDVPNAPEPPGAGPVVSL